MVSLCSPETQWTAPTGGLMPPERRTESDLGKLIFEEE